MQRGKKGISKQVKAHANKPVVKKKKYEGDFGTVISTGSTLLDLAISGGRIRGGGLPTGIIVEIFGPSGSGKTVLLSEIAGTIQRAEGEIVFFDPEARLNKQFARIFDLNIKDIAYSTPNTIKELFEGIAALEASKSAKIKGIFADSLAALSTDIEMDNTDGDKMGMRRPKEFSENFRKYARFLAQKDVIFVVSNQIRENVNRINKFSPKYSSPGGKALEHYPSLRLQTTSPEKIWAEKTIKGIKTKRVIGIKTKVSIHKSSVWKPHGTADISIYFDYGIDDIRTNLQYIKTNTRNTVYTIGDSKLDKEIAKSISIIEDDDLEDELRENVIDLWEEIERAFKTERKKKKR